MADIRQLDNYVAASIQEPQTVLGMRLRPFCLGHLFLMKRLDIPFSSDDPDTTATPWDLMRAVIVCSMTYEQGLEFIYNENPFKHNTLENLLTTLTGKTYAVRWFNQWNRKLAKAFKSKKLDAIEEFGKFDVYRRTDLYVPYFTIEVSNNGRSSGAHWSMNVFQFLVKDLGFTETEAHNMPLARALVEYYKGLDSAGCITLMNDYECAVTEGTIKNG